VGLRRLLLVDDDDDGRRALAERKPPLAALLAVAFGGLGSYAAYYSMTQDLSRKHQGKISGGLATLTWIVTASFHPIFGDYLDKLDKPNKYDLAVGVVGWLPMVALFATLALWNLRGRRSSGIDQNGEGQR
jgi:hypothetical protein